MPTNDNTVNIKDRAGRYHHGDLQAALIAEGLAQLETKTPDAVSLREIARNVGVSATAVYRHFPDKAALLKALCAEGSRQLAEAFRAAMANEADRRDAFVAMGRAYVRFALAKPSLFRLLTTVEAPAGDGADPEADAHAMLSNTLRELMPEGASAAERDIRRLQAWSVVHGLAMLMLDGQVPADERLIDQVVTKRFL